MDGMKAFIMVVLISTAIGLLLATAVDGQRDFEANKPYVPPEVITLNHGQFQVDMHIRDLNAWVKANPKAKIIAAARSYGDCTIIYEVKKEEEEEQ